jgi:hypothetical protein
LGLLAKIETGGKKIMNLQAETTARGTSLNNQITFLNPLTECNVKGRMSDVRGRQKSGEDRSRSTDYADYTEEVTPVEFPLGSPIQLGKDELPIPVKVEFDEYYLPARAPGRLALPTRW